MFNIERHGDTTILAVWENLDFASQEAFDGVLRAVAARATGPIIVSLEHAQFCDSKGLDVLLRYGHQLGTRLTVVIPPGHASRRVFELCRIPQLMSIRPSLREAFSGSPPAVLRSEVRRRRFGSRNGADFISRSARTSLR